MPTPWAEVPASKWDSWDMLSYLGLESLQPRSVRIKAPKIDRERAHALGPDNSYLHPEEHRIRSACVFPFLTRQPEPHQLQVVVQYFSQLYSTDSKIQKADRFILADATGLGKTTEMAMIVGFALWIKQNGPLASKSSVCQKTHPSVLAGNFTECVQPLMSTHAHAIGYLNAASTSACGLRQRRVRTVSSPCWLSPSTA